MVDLEGQTLYWWIDHVSTIASAPLALVGFGFTFWQLAKTKSAAESAKASAEETRKQIRRANLLSLLPQLHRIEDEVSSAIRLGSVELVMAWLSLWRWQASEVRGYLNSDVASEKKVMKAIQTSISVAADAKFELIDLLSQDLVKATSAVRKAIASVTGELGSLSSVQGSGIEGN
jgi:hypothetical protein